MKILDPEKIGNIKIKNRIIFPSMCLYYSDSEGNLTEKFKEFYRKRAESGVGAFIIGANHTGKNKWARPSINDDSKIKNWTGFNEMLHGYGSKVFCQLHPSGIQFGRKEYKESPLDLTTEQVYELINQYVAGAVRAKKAGFDGIEIHGAHGHEVAIFLSTVLNQRNDEFGDGLKGHALIITEMISKIKSECGNDFPVILRISGEERIENGRELPETIEICKLAQNAGADAIHISVSMPASEEWECAPGEVPEGHLSWMGKEVKKNLNIPVIIVGRIVDWEVGERIVNNGEADFLAVGRAMLADPDWMGTIGSDRKKYHRVCIGCNQGCRTKRKVEKTMTLCFQNPILGHEEEINIQPSGNPKKICIIGAGLSGLEAANVLSLKKHNVTIYEKNDKIGGLFNYAAIPPGKNELKKLLKYYENILKERGVKYIFNKTVDDLEDDYDEIIVAIGGMPIVPGFDFDKNSIIMAEDLLVKNSLEDRKYVVVGNGNTGLEVADFIVNKGKDVIVVGDSENDEEDSLGIGRWRFMKKRFNEGNVKIIKDSLITKIEPDSFTVTKSDSATEEIKGSYIFVIACGYVPNLELYKKLKDKYDNVHIVGTAAKIADGMETIHNSFCTCLTI